MTDLVLPAFEMDCRDWLVMNPADVGLSEDVEGAPLLAVLSTLVVDYDVHEATGSLTVGIIEDDCGLTDLDARPVAPGCAAHELPDDIAEPGTRRYVMPAPGQRLALLAEFTVPDDAEELLDWRVEKLMTSFRWQQSA